MYALNRTQRSMSSMGSKRVPSGKLRQVEQTAHPTRRAWVSRPVRMNPQDETTATIPVAPPKPSGVVREITGLLSVRSAFAHETSISSAAASIAANLGSRPASRSPVCLDVRAKRAPYPVRSRTLCVGTVLGDSPTSSGAVRRRGPRVRAAASPRQLLNQATQPWGVSGSRSERSA